MHQKNEEGLSPASAGKTKQELDQMNNEELMALYKQTGDNDIKWALAMRFQEPLRRIAMRTCGAYGGMNQLEDVIHEGLLTLLNAMDRFDPEKGVKLETYVAKRLRGIVIDLGRKQDWMPRQLRQKSSRINRAEEELSMTLGREPTDRDTKKIYRIWREPIWCPLRCCWTLTAMCQEGCWRGAITKTRRRRCGGKRSCGPPWSRGFSSSGPMSRWCSPSIMKKN